MADGDERRAPSTRTRGKPVSYKEPGDLKISQIEGKKDQPVENNDEGNSSDEEDFEQPKNKVARGTSNKKRRGSGAAAPTSPAPRGRPPANKAQQRHSIDGTESLFGIISSKPSAMPMAVKQWWSDYEKDPSAAVGKLTNMMIEACGLAERLPPEAFSEDDDKDVDDYIAGLVERCTSGKVRDEEEASAVTGASVFAKKDKASKKVRANFCDFWDKFVDNAPEVDLRSLHEHPFCPWLHAMSTSPLKVLRQVATTVGLGMMLGVVSKANYALESMSDLERLHEAASKKKDLREMDRTREQIESKREIRKDADQCILSFFNSIFIHRYKDLHGEVRAQCVQSVGDLIVGYKEKFLDNSYLKYVGWALYDKEPEVRMAALEAVNKFYDSKLVNSMEAFTLRFRERMLQMILDVDKHVQITAMSTALSMAQQDMLADDAGLKLRENVYSMITEEDADVRAAAAEFIVEIYIKSDIEVEWKKQQKREKNTSTASSRKLYLIKGMVELLHVVAHECEELAHVMAPLLTTMSTMKNYADILDDVDMLCEIMLEEEGDDCLEMDQKATLGRMILGVLATKSDLAEQPDESQLRTQSKKGHEAEKHTEATLTVGNKMPKLLSLFKADVAALTPLVGCLEHFALGAFNAKHSTIKEIAEALADITRKASDENLLAACAVALAHFADAAYASKDAVQAIIKNLVKTLAADLKKVADAFCGKSQLKPLQALALRRMMSLSGHFDVFKFDPNVTRDAVRMLGPLAEEDCSIAAESKSHAMVITSHYLAWAVLNRHDTVDKVTEAKEELVDCCRNLLASGDGLHPQLRAQAAAALADCFHILGKNLDEDERPGSKQGAPVELLKADVEDFVPYVDNALMQGGDAFELDADVDTVTHLFPESQHDPSATMRLQAVALLKPSVYGPKPDTDESFCDLCDTLATLTLHRPYPSNFHQKLLEQMRLHVYAVAEDQSEFWKLAHSRMVERIGREIESRKTKKVTDDMYSAMVESISMTTFDHVDELYHYVKGSFEWVMKEWDGPRVLFLPPLQMKVKSLDRGHAGDLLRSVDQALDDQNVLIDDDDDKVKTLRDFRQSVSAQSQGKTFAPPAQKKATPAAKAKAGNIPRARLTFTPSGTPAASQGSGSKRGSSGKRKSRPVGSDDEDEEGWVAAPSRGSSSVVVGSGGKRKK